MIFLKRVLADKEVKAALEVVDECDTLFSSHGLYGDCFKIIKTDIVPHILKSSQTLKDQLNDGHSVRSCVYTAIATIGQKHITSGKYHMHRGELSSVGPGPALHKICDKAMDFLVIEGAVTKENCEQWKTDLETQIASTG